MITGHASHAEQYLAQTGVLLLACLTRDSNLLDQIEMLHGLSERWSRWVRVVTLVGECEDTFPPDLDLMGTPSFLLFVDGREADRLLGLASPMELDNMLFPFGLSTTDY